jgi:hypothetical protein
VDGRASPASTRTITPVCTVCPARRRRDPRRPRRPLSADTDQVELALATHVLELAELLGQLIGGAGHDPQVHEVHPLDVQRAQVLLDAGAQLGRRLGRQPPALPVAASTDLGDEPEPLRIGMQRVVDQLVDDVGGP